MCFIVYILFPVLQSLDMHENSKYEKTGLKSFKHVINFLTIQIKSNIFKLLSDCTALVLDGKCTSDAHYVGVFVTSLTNNHNGLEAWCLELLDSIGVSRKGTDMHIKCIEPFLSVLYRCMKIVLALMEENWSTNQSIEERWGAANLFRGPSLSCCGWTGYDGW